MIPDETTYCIDSIPRWQRKWLKEHRSINRSGFFQKCLNILIEYEDPKYFERYREYAEKIIRRQDTTPLPETLFKMSNKHKVVVEPTIIDEVDTEKPSKDKIMKEFMKRVQKTQTCWLWTGTIRPEGYGTFNLYNYGTNNAHRVSYELFKGEIPPKLDIDHKCRVKMCVNPDHLEAVTRKENIKRAHQYPRKEIGEKQAEEYKTPDWEKLDAEIKNLKKSS